jgi:hypothetical protein
MCWPSLIVVYIGFPVDAQYTNIAIRHAIHVIDEKIGTIQ